MKKKAATSGPRFELFADRVGAHRWRLVAANNEIVAQSEAYTRQADAERATKDVTAVVLSIVAAQTATTK